MDEIRKKLSNLTVRDLSVLLLCAITVFLLRPRQKFKLEPEWRIQNEKSNAEKIKHDDRTYYAKLPDPIITDMESDGINEVVLITNDLKLKILALPPSKDSHVLPHMEVLREVKVLLNPSNNRQAKNLPVAMGTGYLEKYQSMVQVRKQVIVIATSHWEILCYDHNLKLLWKHQLLSVPDSSYYMQAMSVLVFPHSVKKNQECVVVVTGCYGKVHKTDSEKVVSEPKQKAKHDSDNDDDQSEFTKQDNFTHLSTFALNGADGAVLWHHLPGEFHEQMTMEKGTFQFPNSPEKEARKHYVIPKNGYQGMFQAHHWKLGLKKGHLHAGEVQWTKYQRDIIDHMPLHWEELKDTNIQLAKFKKGNTKQTDESSTLSNLIDLDKKHIMGYQYGGMRPHSPVEHVENPNAVVIKSHRGIEVLNLLSGQPMTSYKIYDSDGVYADINGDGSIDHIYIDVSYFEVEDSLKFDPDEIDKDFEEDVTVQGTQHCLAIAESLFPIKKQIFVKDFCKWANWIFGPFSSAQSVQEDGEVVVQPTLVKSIAKRKGIFNHLLVLSFYHRHQGFDSVFLSSSGKLTSFGPSGDLHWQTVINGKWDAIGRAMSLDDKYIPTDMLQDYSVYTPAVKAMALQVFGQEDAVAITSWHYLSLVDLKEGIKLADHSLPCTPSDRLITGDFDNDGWTDVIVTCTDSILGFSLQPVSTVWYTIITGVVIVLAAYLLTWLCTPQRYETDTILQNTDEYSPR